MNHIGIVVPVYNSEKFLDECLSSLLSQTYSNFTVVLVDDGSSDRSPSICDYYARKDKRVVVIHKENGGQANARNTGLDYLYKNVSFDFLSFVDSDDVLEKEYLHSLIENINDSDIVISSFKKNINGVIKSLNYKLNNLVVNEEEFWDLHIPGSITIVPWNKLYRKFIFDDIRYPLIKYCEDGFVIHHLIGKAKKIKIISCDYYIYRIRNNSVMTSINYRDKSYWLIQFESQMDKIRYFYKKNNINQFLIEHNKLIDIVPKIYFSHYKAIKISFKESKKYYKNFLKNNHICKSFRWFIFYNCTFIYSLLYTIRHRR